MRFLLALIRWNPDVVPHFLRAHEENALMRHGQGRLQVEFPMKGVIALG
jgi:hypothetical protein